MRNTTNVLKLHYVFAAATSLFLLACAPAETEERRTSEETQSAVASETSDLQSGEVTLLSPEEFNAMILRGEGNMHILDVRTPGEMREGCIEGAVLANLNDRPLFESRAEALNPEEPVMVYCEVGGRSRVAADVLSKRGFKVYDLRGGMRAWRKTAQKIIFPDGNL